MNNVIPPILKSKKDQNNMISALDIGTSKVVVIVAELQPDGVLKIIGKGQHVSKGLKKGVVINIEHTMQAIQRAVEEAELMADCKITEVYTGIAGSHIKSLNSHGMVKIKDDEVTQIDVDRVHKIENKVHHDVIAFLTSITEKVGIEGKFLHQGMTSSDVLDTCFNIQLVQASKILNKDINKA